MEKIFQISDLIVPTLKFSTPCPIRVRITEEFIFLYVGQRDWQWRISDSSLIGCGMSLCPPTKPN